MKAFITKWEKEGKLPLTFVNQEKQKVSALFDAIIALERPLAGLYPGVLADPASIEQPFAESMRMDRSISRMSANPHG